MQALTVRREFDEPHRQLRSMHYRLPKVPRTALVSIFHKFLQHLFSTLFKLLMEIAREGAAVEKKRSYRGSNPLRFRSCRFLPQFVVTFAKAAAAAVFGGSMKIPRFSSGAAADSAFRALYDASGGRREPSLSTERDSAEVSVVGPAADSKQLVDHLFKEKTHPNLGELVAIKTHNYQDENWCLLGPFCSSVPSSCQPIPRLLSSVSSAARKAVLSGKPDRSYASINSQLQKLSELVPTQFPLGEGPSDDDQLRKWSKSLASQYPLLAAQLSFNYSKENDLELGSQFENCVRVCLKEYIESRVDDELRFQRPEGTKHEPLFERSYHGLVCFVWPQNKCFPAIDAAACCDGTLNFYQLTTIKGRKKIEMKKFAEHILPNLPDNLKSKKIYLHIVIESDSSPLIVFHDEDGKLLPEMNVSNKKQQPRENNPEKSFTFRDGTEMVILFQSIDVNELTVEECPVRVLPFDDSDDVYYTDQHHCEHEERAA